MPTLQLAHVIKAGDDAFQDIEHRVKWLYRVATNHRKRGVGQALQPIGAGDDAKLNEAW